MQAASPVWARFAVALSVRAARLGVTAVHVAVTAWLAVAAWLAGVPLCVLGSQAAAAEDRFRSDVQPILRKYCLDCHGDDEPEGEISFAQFADGPSASRERALWLKARTMLAQRRMPPSDAEQPTAAERAAVLDWIEKDLLAIDCSGPQDPGRVTIRRLTRGQYNNTVRDLLGVSFRPGDDFPQDDVGYGFDSIGDVLTISPLLLEKYLAAAQRIVGDAIVTDRPAGGARTRYSPSQIAVAEGGRREAGAAVLFSNGQVEVAHEFAQAGRYVVRIGAFGEQAGDEPVRMEMRLDAKPLETFDVPVTRREPRVYERTVTVESGTRRVSAAFINDFYQPDHPNPRRRDRNLLIQYIEIQGPLDQRPEDLPEVHRRIVFATPAESGKSSEECARRVLGQFAKRAFRRPVTSDELRRLVRLVAMVEEDGGSYEQGVAIALQAILVSPHFLFRVELDRHPDEPDRPHLISEHELATRLSYFLWSTMPDDELTALADAGTLRAQLEPQVRRMLADQRSSAFVEDFAGQWLETRELARIEPDRRLFPDFDDALRGAMRTETEMFFAAVLREDRSVLDLLDGQFTFVNERLARHYGINNVRGEEFRRVSLAGTYRGGVLTHASVLTITSNPTRTSPVKRGKWIMEQILGTPPPPPPPDVEELSDDEAVVASASLRQRLEMHRTKAACAVCHEQMDALGFALENFDAIGRWRTQDGKFRIDASGTLPGGREFNGPVEMKTILRDDERDAFVRCLAEKTLMYAIGRGVEWYDKCAVDTICEEAAKNEYKFSSLVMEVVKSQPFQMRRAKRPGD
jgi:hypothetical protein